MNLLEKSLLRKIFVCAVALLPSWASLAIADEPEGYYESAYGKSGYALKTALHQIIRDHASLSYKELWEAFRTTDVREDGYVWDMYSDCDFRFGSNQCGNYKQEGDCYNREHSFPKSWFDDASPMYTDLFHLYPTDGYVNGRRGNNPFGEVDNPTYTSQAGCKVGPNATPGYSGTVFEPLDEYKGDFARTYFYMATRYEDRIANWGSCPICNGSDDQAFDSWVVDLLLQWHEQDPVSDKERERNDAVYVYQENRNPFIDYPELVEKIWGEDNTPFDPENPDPDPEPNPDPEPEPEPDPEPEPEPGPNPDTLWVENWSAPADFRMYPNPTTGEVFLGLPSVGKIEVYAVSGQRIRDLEADSDEVVLRLSRSGIYFIRFVSREGIAVKRLLVL